MSYHKKEVKARLTQGNDKTRQWTPDVSVTENFKQKEIKSFEDYMKLALNMLPAIKSAS